MAILDNVKGTFEKAKDGVVDKAKDIKDDSKNIVVSYEQALDDSEEILDFINGINSPDELLEKALPECITDMRKEDSSRAKKYIFAAETVGGPVLAAITMLSFGKQISNGDLVAGRALLGASAFGAVGAMAFAPGVIPSLLINTTPKLIATGVVANFVKKNKPKLLAQNEEMKEATQKVRLWLDESVKDSKTAVAWKNTKSKEILEDYYRKGADYSKKIAIQIDDLANVDSNRRILQYNAIIENQYKKQRELELAVEGIMAEYVSLETENAKFEKKIEILTQLLVSMECPKAVIESALKGKEE